MTLQDEIQKIQKDTSLDANTKKTRIQEAMRNWTHTQVKRVQEKKKPIHPRDEDAGAGIRVGAGPGPAAANTVAAPKPPGSGPICVGCSNGPLVFKKPEQIVQCGHYERGCEVACPECNVFYNCRICHDENENHTMDRHAVKQVRCKRCQTVQAPAKNCVQCGYLFGHYFCSVCNLWQNKNVSIFHCNGCGICRLGKKEDYIHCDKCGMCYLKSFYPTHKCREDCTKSNCPVCGEYMFDTREEIAITRCGHSIHQKCLKDLLRHDFRCPLCKKSVVDMTEQWKMYDMLNSLEMSKPLVERLPMEYQDKRLVIFCNDCEQKSDIEFNFDYRKCSHCGGYNTNEISMYDTSWCALGTIYTYCHFFILHIGKMEHAFVVALLIIIIIICLYVSWIE